MGPLISRQRGFTFFEVMLYLVIAPLIVTPAVAVWYETWGTMTIVADESLLANSVTRALARMGSDIRAAGAAAVVSENGGTKLVLRSPDQTVVTWELVKVADRWPWENRVRRTAGEDDVVELPLDGLEALAFTLQPTGEARPTPGVELLLRIGARVDDNGTIRSPASEVRAAYGLRSEVTP